MTYNTITLLVFLAPFAIWIPWELVLVLYLRPKAGREGKPRPATISMVARGLGYKLPSIPYLWGGLGVHFWVNRSAWGATWAGVLFWLAPVLLFVYSGLTWREEPAAWPRWKRLALHPVTWLTLGGLAGFFLFPQTFPSF